MSGNLCPLLHLEQFEPVLLTSFNFMFVKQEKASFICSVCQRWFESFNILSARLIFNPSADKENLQRSIICARSVFFFFFEITVTIYISLLK